MLNPEIIAGIFFLVLCVAVFILTPYYWCSVTPNTNSTFLCCLPTILIAIFIVIGVCLIVIGEENTNHRLRY